MSDRLYFSVPDECDNMLAQRFLRDKCGLSARIITRLKREKDGILMDGKILRTIDCVQSGKTVSIAIPDEKCEIEPTKGTLDIRYEDEHFLVVNKPHSMPVHPVKQHQSDTLANIVSYYCSQNGKPFVFRAINRLDKDTSGLVLITKNRFTANAVKNKTHKVYYALCEGEINIEGVVDKPMDLRDDSKMVRIVRDDGMKAVTHYKPLVATKDIYVTLGSPWVPTDIIDDFIEHLLGDWRRYWYSIDNEEDFNTKHDELTGTWEIPFKSRYNHDVKVTRTYGTDRINALYILERTLNMKSVAVTDEVVCKTNSSGKKRVINRSETILAIEKQNKMIKMFQKWIWEDERRKERLEMIFENNFSCVRKRIFDGSFLRFPEIVPCIKAHF